MIMISRRLNSLTKKAIAATTIALSFAVLTPKAADAANFHLNFSSNIDGEKKSIGTGSFSVDDKGKITDYTSTSDFAGGQSFTKENIKTGSFDINTKQFINLELNKGVTLKLKENGKWNFLSHGNLIKKGHYTVTKKVPEPFTILGSVTALGIGGLLKKQHSKKLKKQEIA
ncbi:MAG: PEP-CTERM sorting domain-containing protein [Symploca sp. SIO2E9]|nr:PEP-CTERM sorting domain-containing protein [Symploca sp. SIO2E9]